MVPKLLCQPCYSSSLMETFLDFLVVLAPHSQERKSNGPGLSQVPPWAHGRYRAARVHMSLEIQNGRWRCDPWESRILVRWSAHAKTQLLWYILLKMSVTFLFPVELNWISPLRYQHGGSVSSPRHSFSVLFHILTDFVIPAFLHLTDPCSCSRLGELISQFSLLLYIYISFPSLIPDEMKYFWIEGEKEIEFRNVHILENEP